MNDEYRPDDWCRLLFWVLLVLVVAASLQSVAGYVEVRP